MKSLNHVVLWGLEFALKHWSSLLQSAHMDECVFNSYQHVDGMFSSAHVFNLVFPRTPSFSLLSKEATLQKACKKT